MKMRVVLPCRGEFGLKIRFHLPAVHALPSPKLVCIEPGEQALYPNADHYVIPRADDDLRRGTHPKGDRAFVAKIREHFVRRNRNVEFVQTRKGMPERRFVPEPHVRYGINASVVICPRKRVYGADKNWPHWDRLATLPGAFAAGAPDSSYDVECPRAWAYPRFLDASIEAMLSARLVIATDAGLAHLAVLCGAPLLLITHEGKVAPGAVRDPEGRAMEPEYWPVRWDEYYVKAAHTGAHMEMIDGWMYPERVVERASELLQRERVA